MRLGDGQGIIRCRAWHQRQESNLLAAVLETVPRPRAR